MTSGSVARDRAVTALRYQVAGFVALLLGLLALAFGVWPAPERGLWWVGAGTPAVHFVVVLWRHLDENRPERDLGLGLLSPRLGWGTWLTLLRVVALCLLSGYLLSLPLRSSAWLPGTLYFVVGAADGLDGYLARKTEHATALGGLLDQRVDILATLIASLLAVRLGRLPSWYLLLGAAWFLFQGGLLLRRALGLCCNTQRLRPSAHARVFAGLHMGLLTGALLPWLDARALELVAAIFLVPSLVTFARDFAAVAGWLVPGSQRYTRCIARFLWLTRSLLPVVLRCGFVVTLVALTLFDRVSTPASLLALRLGAAVALGFGFLPRVAALLTLLMFAFALPAGILPWLLVAQSGCLLLLGAGSFACYQPEETWLFERHGAKRRALMPVLPAADP